MKPAKSLVIKCHDLTKIILNMHALTNRSFQLILDRFGLPYETHKECTEVFSVNLFLLHIHDIIM